MRITLVMASAEDGGLEKHVLELANALSPQHDVTLIAHQRFANQLQAKAQFIAMDLSGSRHNPWTKYCLKKQIKNTYPDVLHVHAAKTAQLVQGMVSKFSFPCIVTVHGKKKKADVNLKFDRIIVVSEQLKNQFDQNEKIDVVYNGVNINKLPQPFEKNRKFIAIGRLNVVKGFDVILQAWQKIPYQLNIAGDGEEHDHLEQLIGHFGLQDRVKLLGYQQNIAELISSHEALIVSSLREGGPYTLGEALLLQRPVIGTNVGMMSEFIDQAWLCEPNMADKLMQVIEDYCAIHDPEQVFSNAFSLAKQHLTQDRMLEHTVEVYQKAIAQKKIKLACSV